MPAAATCRAVFLGSLDPVALVSIAALPAPGDEALDLLDLREIETEHAELLAEPAGIGGQVTEAWRQKQLEYLPLHQEIDMLFVRRFGMAAVRVEAREPLSDRQLAVAKIEYLRAALVSAFRRACV